MTPNSNRIKRGNDRRNKRDNRIMEVRTVSAVPPYKSNVIFTQTFRYTSLNAANAIGITRGNLLNSFLVGLGSTLSARLIAAVRLNWISCFAGVQNNSTMAIDWRSNNGPSSEKSVTGTPSSPGVLTTGPPGKSLASFWSLTSFNESEVLVVISSSGSSSDILDVSLSFVLMDGEAPVNVTTTASSTGSTLYRSFFDGPRGGAVWQPVSVLSIN